MSMLKMAAQNLRSRVQGCLVGAVSGDCLGADFEISGVPEFSKLNGYFTTIRTGDATKDELRYTDDTAMARCVAQTLIDTKGQFDSTDLARKFAAEYTAAPDRGYGASASKILPFLAEDEDDVFALSSAQFGGSGSYGNGGAMRVAAVALCPQSEFDQMINIARQSAQLTHSNALGYNGAILQCSAVHLALHADPATFDPQVFLTRLMDIMEKQTSCRTGDDGQESGKEEPAAKQARREGEDDEYLSKLRLIPSLLAEDAPTKKVASELGNLISAHNSVPAAIYSFLRCLKPIEGFQVATPLERTILYAVSLDGDTDTIGSMAGAIAGAFYGMEAVPKAWMTACEGAQHGLQQADSLYDVKFGQK